MPAKASKLLVDEFARAAGKPKAATLALADVLRFRPHDAGIPLPIAHICVLWVIDRYKGVHLGE